MTFRPCAHLFPFERRIVEAWPADKRMEFEELAAWLEFEQGLPAERAEREAYRTVRERK